MLKFKKSSINGIMFDASEPLHPLLSQYLASKGAHIRYIDDCVEITGGFSLPNKQTILAELEAFSIKNYGAIVYDLEFHTDKYGQENFRLINKPVTENCAAPETNFTQTSEQPNKQDIKPNTFTPTFTEKVNAKSIPATKTDEPTFKGLKKGFLISKPKT